MSWCLILCRFRDAATGHALYVGPRFESRYDVMQ